MTASNMPDPSNVPELPDPSDWQDPAVALWRGHSLHLPGAAAQPVPIQNVLAIGTVTLSARDTPRGILKLFYTQTLGLSFVKAESTILHLRHHQLEVILDADRVEPGRVGLLLRNFGQALHKLREKRIPLEVFRTDGGLTRVALLRDPAANLVQLIETRAF